MNTNVAVQLNPALAVETPVLLPINAVERETGITKELLRMWERRYGFPAPQRDARGGVTPAPYMEWGGRNLDGSDGFKEHRPGWSLPIHQLLVKNGVSAVFHGHDHLFAREELDGIIYQEVPQPGHPSGGTRSADEYGYTGVILGSSGHLRVAVDPKEAVVEYVLAAVPGITKDHVANASVAHRYSITPRPNP